VRAVSDETLLLAGCIVTFIACAGAYVGLREGFSYGRSTARERATHESNPPELVAAKPGVASRK
jgi:hypothetical protein